VEHGIVTTKKSTWYFKYLVTLFDRNAGPLCLGVPDAEHMPHLLHQIFWCI